MFSKRTLISGLLVLNLILAAGIWLCVPRGPAVFAQTRVGSGGYLAVTAKPDGETYDAVWVLDIGNDRLTVFYPATRRFAPLTASEPRDLRADLGRGAP